MQLHDLSPDSLNAELAYRREQLTGTTFLGRGRVRKARVRRSIRRAA